jgi:hypothetical protein
LIATVDAAKRRGFPPRALFFSSVIPVFCSVIPGEVERPFDKLRAGSAFCWQCGAAGEQQVPRLRE